MEFGAKDCALELTRMPIPVPEEDVLAVGGFNQCQKSAKELRIRGSLDRLVGLEVDRNNQDGSGLGFPQKGLKPAAFDVIVLKLRDSMMVGVQDQDTSMVAVVVVVGVGWKPKGPLTSKYWNKVLCFCLSR